VKEREVDTLLARCECGRLGGDRPVPEQQDTVPDRPDEVS
jgi:hypothetical protein